VLAKVEIQKNFKNIWKERKQNAAPEAAVSKLESREGNLFRAFSHF
jgi:hypothetical protein